jgi:hypothetical protein
MKVYLHKGDRWYEAFLPVYEKKRFIMALHFSQTARLDVWDESYITRWPLVTNFKPTLLEMRNSFIEIFTNYIKYKSLIK